MLGVTQRHGVLEEEFAEAFLWVGAYNDFTMT